MAIGPRLELRQGQTLVMTPQLRQAIQLLQYSNLELAAFVEQELERNPLLERDETPRPPEPEQAEAGAAFSRGRGGSPGFAAALLGIEDLAPTPRPLREHLGRHVHPRVRLSTLP